MWRSLYAGFWKKDESLILAEVMATTGTGSATG